MVIDKFKCLLTEAQISAKIDLERGVHSDSVAKFYNEFRQNLIDLIVELSQGASVDWDELNATMRDWR